MSNNPFSDRLVMIISLLIAFGAPTAGGIAFSVTQDPRQAIGVAVLYGLAVLIFGFVTKIWQKVEDPWAESVANWLNHKMQYLFLGPYRERYLQHLIDRHRAFDVKGLTTQGIYNLELEQVFVELSMAPQPAHQVSTDPIGETSGWSRSRRIIWDYLHSKQMTAQNFVIIGPPGSGKTTLLKHMTLTLVAGRRHRQSNLLRRHQLPILLFLRDSAEIIKARYGFSLTEVVQDSLTKWGMQAAPGWFESQLAKGRCLVMLDGLDEVADLETRRKVVEWVEQQMITHARNRFIITSRPFGYRSTPLSGVTVLEVRPFTNEQIQRFVHNWYLANEIMSAQRDDRGVHMSAQEGAKDLLQRLRNAPALSALSVNPLLLTMIATVHRYRSSLPGRRVELYAEILRGFFGQTPASTRFSFGSNPRSKATGVATTSLSYDVPATPRD